MSFFLCCFACTVSTKLPFFAILIRVSFGKIFGLDILPLGHRFVLILFGRFSICCVRLCSSVRNFCFAISLRAVGGNVPNSVTLVASARIGTLATARLCTCSRGIVALRKFGCKNWTFMVCNEIRVLFLEPHNQRNWPVSVLIGVRGDLLWVC
jgi:hypothetical protein